jgi:transposase
MNSTFSTLPTLDTATQYQSQRIVEQDQEIQDLRNKVNQLQHQLDWFKRQLFGQKSERRIDVSSPDQMSLGEVFVTLPTQLPASQTVASHTRRVRQQKDSDQEGLSFFDAERVPMETIDLRHSDAIGLTEDQYEVIGYKDSYRLAQRPGSYVVLHYRREQIKRRDTEQLLCPSAPAGVIDGSRADVSFLAGLTIDKLLYHIPLYRQHRRLIDAGFTLSRSWLIQLVQQVAALLEPIYEAQLDSIRASRVKAMDETPIKAGKAEKGKMKSAYFWPIYGEHDEICFPFFESRRSEHVQQALGLDVVEGGVLLSDGYTAYAKYAEKTGLTHAQCWAHSRRKFFDAQTADPEASSQALEQIALLYAAESHIKEHKLKGQKKLEYRQEHSKPVIERFFSWVESQFERQGLLPSSPLTEALNYVRVRRGGLEIFLLDPDVPIDTNHLERALRSIPMGRRNWLFCWTEMGAKQIGILQSLLTTCRLHQIDPYTYLVDVLLRISQQPASQVSELTPRIWKQRFAAKPLRSDLDSFRR